MKTRIILTGLALFFLNSQSAMAAWGDGDRDTIIQNVKDVKEEVIGSGDTRAVVSEFRDQLSELVDRGVILRESVDDFFKWLRTRERPYRNFVGPAGSARCGPGTQCDGFRNDLINFFLENGDQRFNFPIIDKVGLGDGRRAVSTVRRSPPIVLFGLYEVMNRIPDWKEMPANLQSIFNEIGDPEVFSVRLQEDEAAPLTSRSASPAMFIGRTPTQRFCDRWEKRVDKEMDPVRLNRIKFFVYFLRQILGGVESLTSETIGGTVVGEGTETVIPNPIKAVLKILEIEFDVIQRGIQTFRDNLGVCRAQRRELEIQVAQCIKLVDFILPSKRDDVYFLVQTKVENADAEGMPVVLSKRSLKSAERARNSGNWKLAYLRLCTTYRQIGEG